MKILKLEKVKNAICYNASRSMKTGLFETERQMSETIHVERVGRTPTTAVELVHSPDDGGYYLSNANFQNMRGRVSTKIYKTRAAALKDWNAGTVEWEDWN